MKCAFAGLSDPGLVRSYNQDNYYIDTDGRFFVLADGMGGHTGGEQASKITIEVIKDYLQDNWDSPLESYDLLEKAVFQANEAILEDQNQHPERADMGTTVVVIIFRQGETWRAHIGDSRLYRLHDGNLIQVTLDHTWIGQAIRAGEISLEDAKHHPWRHVLSQCLGRRDLFDGIDIHKIDDVTLGDRFLLCSDGLTEEVADPMISQLLSDGDDLEKVADKLVTEAKNNGGSDNVTVVLVNVLDS
ncbi:MAG: serine/threonine-protein phosphatase [Cyanobacterium sp. T60_A2020_053]|nr:serine/threonine-protein phosphatase [Cyanobacterium sp. T60_A2020_053]